MILLSRLVSLALGDQVNVNIYNNLLSDLSPAIFNNRAFKNVQRDGGVILAEILCFYFENIYNKLMH